VTRKSTPLDFAAPVQQIRKLSGLSYQRLALASGYTPGASGRGNAGSIQSVEGLGSRVQVGTLTRVAKGGGVRIDARARSPGGPWRELVLATLADAPISIGALHDVAAWLGVDLRIEASRETGSTPLADAALGALADRASETGRPVLAHLVREVAAEGRGKK